MKQRFEDQNWKNLLPQVYQWAERVKVDLTPDLAKNNAILTVVLTQSNPLAKDTFSLNAPQLPAQERDSWLDAVLKTGWKASAGTQLCVINDRRVLFVVPPKIKTTAAQKSRAVGMEIAKTVKSLKVEDVEILKADGYLASELFLGISSGFYQLDSFKGNRKKEEDQETMPKSLRFTGWDGSEKEALANARHMAAALAFTRFLQDAPGNWMNPIRFADIAAELAKDNNFTAKILNKTQIQALGMGSFISVSDGSVIEPRLIVLEIKGADPKRNVALVGKGLTFDSGGISIKPAPAMDEMKYDMSGGASVLGAAYYFSKVKPPVSVVCVIGATENMPSGSATRPGDIVTAMNGKTIEIQNTDAEGRLVLADLLHYSATEYKPELMIDIATLTGAVLMALGTVGSGLMASDQQVADYILKSAEAAGEPFWQLPLWPEFEKEVKGAFSDLVNIAKPNVKAGTIIGGVFLKEFVGDTKWAHLDIAGTGWSCKATGYPSSGGCAFGLRTMVEACMRINS